MLLINKYQYYKKRYYKEVNSLSTNDFLKKNFLLNAKDAGRIYYENYEIENLFEGHKKYLSDFFIDTDIKLIYRFSELSCNECIVYTSAKLKKYMEKIGSQNIIFLIRYSNINMAKIFCKQLNIDEKQIFMIDNIDVSIDNKSESYFFTIDSNLKSNDFLIPDRQLPEYIDLYLDSIVEKYFNRD